jgi:hypothetical protein
VQNLSKNKLDYYVDTSLALTGDRPTKRDGKITAEITIANTAPSDQRSSYVFGPNDVDQEVGLYKSIVSLYLPTGVLLEGSSGDPTSSPPVETADAGRSVVTFGVDIPAGESRTVTLQLTVAPRASGVYSFSAVPIGRIRPTVVSVDITADGRRVVRPAAPLVAPVTLAGS